MRVELARNLFPGQLAVIALASALAIPAGAQQSQSQQGTQTPPPATSPANGAQNPGSDQVSTGISNSQTADQNQPDVNQKRLEKAQKEGFWGHMQPFARKKWVKRQTDPINSRLNELDEVNAKNSKDIQDVDSRAQAGIHQAQSTADAANQQATAASTQAQQASTVAQGASGHVDQINTRVSGLDQYKSVSDVEVPFRGGAPVLSPAAKQQLDQVVASTNGRQGYIIEVEAHSPQRGATGIQNSQRLANVVNRYLVEHDIPVYRVRAVALGNAQVATNDTQSTDASTNRVRTSSVHVRLMENSLAAQGAASPQGAASSTGAERP
jgi:outer membrane protein OmpA-like peptidoglycan-associated protein